MANRAAQQLLGGNSDLYLHGDELCARRVEKTGTRRQAELVRLVLATPSHCATTVPFGA